MNFAYASGSEGCGDKARKECCVEGKGQIEAVSHSEHVLYEEWLTLGEFLVLRVWTFWLH